MSQAWVIQGDRICQQYNVHWAVGVTSPAQTIFASNYQNDASFQWNIKPVKKYFTIKNIASNLFMTVNNSYCEPQKNISLEESKTKSLNIACLVSKGLVFYTDMDKTITNSLNDMVIDLETNRYIVRLANKSSNAPCQRWKIENEVIKSLYKPRLSLSCSSAQPHFLCATTHMAQKWDINFINNTDDIAYINRNSLMNVINESINRTSLVKQDDNRSLIQENNSNGCIDLPNCSNGRVKRPQLLASSSSDTTSESNQLVDDEAPIWFHSYMNQFRKILAEEVVAMVDRTKMSQSSDSTLIGDLIHEMALEDRSNVHVGIFCDNCDVTIIGIRYKCGNCVNYDLCMQCEAKEDIHDPTHIFVKIKKPVDSISLLNKKGKPAPLIKNVLYKPKLTSKSSKSKGGRKVEKHHKTGHSREQIKKDLTYVRSSCTKECSKK